MLDAMKLSIFDHVYVCTRVCTYLQLEDCIFFMRHGNTMKLRYERFNLPTGSV